VFSLRGSRSGSLDACPVFEVMAIPADDPRAWQEMPVKFHVHRIGERRTAADASVHRRLPLTVVDELTRTNHVTRAKRTLRYLFARYACRRWVGKP
jgi:hypothetical protein